MRLFLAFLAIPVIEILLFIEIGGLIGTWPTIAIVIVTAFLGAFLVRRQGVAVLRQIQSEMEAGRPPARQMAEGALILIAGAFLLTPGFFTDTVGFLLLVPQVRAAAVAGIARRMTVGEVHMRGFGPDTGFSGNPHPGRHTGQPGTPSGPGTVEGEYEEVRDPEPPARQVGSGGGSRQ